MEVPILSIENGESATVGEAMGLFWELVEKSGEYSTYEQKFIRNLFDSFVSTTIRTMSSIERKKDCSFENAKRLRLFTIRPLSHMIVYTLYTSRLISDENEDVFETGHQMSEDLANLYVLTQIADDLHDFSVDLANSNVNLVVGAMRTTGEIDNLGVFRFHRNSTYGFQRCFPQTVNLLRDFFEELKADIRNPPLKEVAGRHTPFELED